MPSGLHELPVGKRLQCIGLIAWGLRAAEAGGRNLTNLCKSLLKCLRVIPSLHPTLVIFKSSVTDLTVHSLLHTSYGYVESNVCHLVLLYVLSLLYGKTKKIRNRCLFLMGTHWRLVFGEFPCKEVMVYYLLLSNSKVKKEKIGISHYFI